MCEDCFDCQCWQTSIHPGDLPDYTISCSRVNIPAGCFPQVAAGEISPPAFLSRGD